jgi:hypothetical protein
MKRPLVIAGSVALVALIVAAIVPMWWMTSDIRISGFGVAMIVLMVIGCFGVGGGLMFLVFYSARHGHDEAVFHGTGWRFPEDDGGS